MDEILIPKTTNRKLTICLSSLIVFVIIPLFKPYNFAQIPLINSVMNLWRVISAAIIVILYLRRHIFSRFIVIFMMFLGVWVLSTIINGGQIGEIAGDLLTAVILSILVELAFQMNKEDSLLNTLYYLFGSYITLYFISVITGVGLFFADSVLKHKTYFFGPDNYSGFILLPALGVMLVTDFYLYQSLRKFTILCFVFVLSSEVYTWSVTALIAMILFGILVIREKKSKRSTRVINVMNGVIITMLMLASIIFFNVQNFFASFLVNVLGKDPSLSSRTIIWDLALRRIYQAPLIGYGEMSSESVTEWLLINHTHNIYMELLFKGGVLLLIAFLVYLFYVGRKLYRNHSHYTARILEISIIIYLLLSFADDYLELPYFYCLMAIANQIGNKLTTKKVESW